MAHRILVDHTRSAPLAVFLIVILGTLLSVLAIERTESGRERDRLSRVAVVAASALERRASINASYLRAGAALFALQPDVDAAKFRRYVTELRLDTDYRGAEGIGWAPFVSVAKDGRATTAGGSPYALPERLAPSLSAKPRSVLTPVTFLYPDTPRNRRAIGFDMYSNAVRRAAMDEAQKSVRPTASGGVVLAQEGERGRQRGFLIYMPVFTTDGGARRLRGFIYSPYNANDLLDSASELFDPGGMRLSLFDGSPTRENLLASINTGERVRGTTIRQDLRLANRPMTLEITSLGSNSLTFMSMITLLFGLALASLLMLVTRLLAKQIEEDQLALNWFAEQNSIRNSLTRELNHRVKNTLANVLSIATLTRRRATSLDDYADALDGRIRALSATHDLLTQSDWGTTPIASVVAAELAPYSPGEDSSVTIDGPMVELAPNDALSLGLALHELGTNASKFGALSTPTGRVSIRWQMVSSDLAQVEWVESGGPQVNAQRKRGFGTDLIEKIVAHELKHRVELVFASDGVRCTLRVPVREPVAFALRAKPRVTGY